MIRSRHFWTAWLLGVAVAAAAIAPGRPAAGARPAAAPVPGKADGRGNLTGLGPEEVEVLREVREMLKRIVLDPHETLEDRRRALAALGRVHEALNDWGLDDQVDWYLAAMASAKPLAGEIVSQAQAAAKGGAYHLGGVREFWSRLEAERGGTLPGEMRHRYAALDRICTEGTRHAPRLAEMLKPLKLQPKTVGTQMPPAGKIVPKSVNLKTVLRPYAEEGSPKQPEPRARTPRK